jgi:hypothetical protein
MRIRRVLIPPLVAIVAPCAAAYGGGLDLSVNWTVFVAGDPIEIRASAGALDREFDAWAVILEPGGGMYFMSLSGAVVPGAAPVARAVPGLPSRRDVTLLSMRVPAGLASGDYFAAAVLMPAGKVPGSVEDAESMCIPGCFARTPFYVISGVISADITGKWKLSPGEFGIGALTINPPPNCILEGTYTHATMGDAAVLGFMDRSDVTLFLNFDGGTAGKKMTLKGAVSDGQLGGTYSSAGFSPTSGNWKAWR